MKEKLIALTFDDGPDATTDKLLSILQELNVKATFFLWGEHIRAFRDTVLRIHNAGHEIGNHSEDHSHLGSLNPGTEKQIREKLEPVSNLIKEITGQAPRFVRAPYLDYSPAVINTIKKMDLPFIDMSINSFDYEGINSECIIDNVINHVHDGGIILLHEPHETTRNALPGIVNYLRSSGYEILPVGELANRKKITLTAGTIYHSL
jgi:peptidoglycan/xylan/chitin deacetylase (PgdA/CDA1 family)